MSDIGEPTPTPLDEAAQEAATVVLPDVQEEVLDIRQGYIVSVDPATNTYLFRFPETATTETLGPAHSILPCRTNDTVWILDRGGMKLILGPQDAGGVPPGSILLWFTATPPDGWVICNGGSTAAYPRLAALFGGTLPDFRSRVPLGAGQGSGLTNRSLGGSGGEETHQLTVGEMPSHTHGSVVHDHDTLSDGTNVLTDGFTGTNANISQGGGAYVKRQMVTGQGGLNVVQAAGSNGAHENMPPWRGVHFIVKW